MRVNVQLIDAETGSHLWARERFERPVTDPSSTCKDEIVARLAGALNAQLVAAEADATWRNRPPRTPTQWTSIFQGLAWLQQGYKTRDNLAQAAQRFFRSRAHRRSRQCRCAHCGSARADAVEAQISLSPDPMAAFTAAEARVGQSLCPLGPGPCARPSCTLGICRYNDQARCRKASPSVSMYWSWIEISRRRPCLDWTW